MTKLTKLQLQIQILHSVREQIASVSFLWIWPVWSIYISKNNLFLGGAFDFSLKNVNFPIQGKSIWYIFRILLQKGKPNLIIYKYLFWSLIKNAQGVLRLRNSFMTFDFISAKLLKLGGIQDYLTIYVFYFPYLIT